MRGTAFAAVLLIGFACISSPVGAQKTRPDSVAAQRALEQKLGRPVSAAEIIERLRQSGMTRAQVRARLQQAGYDPSLADSYFDTLERGGDPPTGQPSGTFLDALDKIGLSVRTLGRQQNDTSQVADSLSLDVDSIKEAAAPEVFGLRTFRRGGREFQPMLFGPVDVGYRLGPGDELILILTGDVEAAYTLDVSREGLIAVPDIGLVSVNGLTLGQLEDALYRRLGQVYSSLSRSPNSSTRMQLSTGALRANQVFVTGDVALPGSHQVGGAAGVFNALYQAGGPTEFGSFRRVELQRGGRTVQTVDLYNFLLRGSAAADVRLESGDRIFVPPVGSQVRVAGAVRRPAIYEVLPNEGLLDVVSFAGGPRSDALVGRIQIDRILPPDQRVNGRYRTLVDVNLVTLAPGAPDNRLFDGDVVHVAEIPDDMRNRIWVDGDVRNPGIYEWSPGITLRQLIDRADGLREAAYLPRAQIYRLNTSDGSRILIQAILESQGGAAPPDLLLMDNDSVVVLSRAVLRLEESVAISGYVKEPETYSLLRGMTLKDLILMAGGFEHGAYMLEADVSRLPDPLLRTDTTAVVYTVSLTPPGEPATGIPVWYPAAADFQLQHGDRVTVRRAPGYQSLRLVTLTGEVTAPGTYALRNRDERLTDVLARAGGVTPQAYVGGMRVIRLGRIVAADLQRATRDPADRTNILLAAGDTIHVPAYDPMVVVAGEITFESRVLYVPGANLQYYIGQAGGYTPRSDKGRTTITYASGERSAVHKSLFGSGTPRIQPGSQIFVPAKPEQGSAIDWDRIFTRVTGLLGAAATILLVIRQTR